MESTTSDSLIKGDYMKRYNNLFKDIVDINNLLIAHANARKHKTYYSEVKDVDQDPKYYCRKIQELLQTKTYIVSPYTTFERFDGSKIRKISKLPYFPDRIIQWAAMQIVGPIFDKLFIYDTYSSIPGRGIHFGLKRVKKALQDEYNTTYCLKLDIKHFYQSINHEILYNQLLHKFKDKDLLWLFKITIDSYQEGVPIGNYFSQYFANFYLTDFDRYCKEDLKIKYYFRYMDDIVILHKNKKFLHWLKRHFDWYLHKNLLLNIKDNWQVFPTNVRGIDFLGYRIFKDYTLLRTSTKTKMKRKMKNINKHQKISYRDNCTIQSYKGWLKHCDSFRLYTKHIQDLEVRYTEQL